jgi:hypothetical protein
MKKITSVLCFLLFAAVAVNAQEFKKFRLATGLGYAMAGGEGSSGGILYAIEPGYRINDALTASLRIEGAVVVRGLSENVSSYDASAAAIGSYTVNGIYYLSNNNFRPYVGAGFGLFNLAAVTGSSSGGTGVAAESKIGFYPRIGFDFNHFNINIDYNIIGATTFEGSDLKMKNSYIGIRIGGFFFGGRN